MNVTLKQVLSHFLTSTWQLQFYEYLCWNNVSVGTRSEWPLALSISCGSSRTTTPVIDLLHSVFFAVDCSLSRKVLFWPVIVSPVSFGLMYSLWWIRNVASVCYFYNLFRTVRNNLVYRVFFNDMLTLKGENLHEWIIRVFYITELQGIEISSNFLFFIYSFYSFWDTMLEFGGEVEL